MSGTKNILWMIYALAAVFLFPGFAAAFSTPDINSSTNTDGAWSDNDTARFTWPTEEGTSYMCSWTNSGKPEFSACNGGKFEKQGVTDGNYLFYLKACDANGANCSEARQFTALIDRTGPQPPQDMLALAAPDGSIKLSWKAPQEISGISGYVVYRSTARYILGREFQPRDNGVKKITGVEGTEYVDSELIDSKSRFYRVQAIDGAGNTGAVSQIATPATSQGSCALTFSVAAPELIASGTNAVRVSAKGGGMVGAQLQLRLPSGGLQSIASGISGAMIDANFSVPAGSTGEGTIILTARDSNNGLCQEEFKVGIDSSPPRVEIASPAAGTEAPGKLALTVSASDDGSGIASVQASIDGKNTQLLAKEGNAFSVEIDTSALERGAHTAKVTAYDTAGNSSDAQISFSVPGKQEDGKPLENQGSKVPPLAETPIFDSSMIAPAIPRGEVPANKGGNGALAAGIFLIVVIAVFIYKKAISGNGPGDKGKWPKAKESAHGKEAVKKPGPADAKGAAKKPEK